VRLHLRPLAVGRAVVWLDSEAPYRRWRYRVRVSDGHYTGREATRGMALSMAETLVRRERQNAAAAVPLVTETDAARYWREVRESRARRVAAAGGYGVVIPA